MMFKLLFNACWLLSAGVLFSHDAALEISFIVSDNAGGSKTLICGLDPMATDSLDRELGEAELPPFPPSGAFEARFVGHDINLPQLGECTYKDFRQGDNTFADTVSHGINYQVGEGSMISVQWELPPGISGQTSDLFDGAVISKNMSGLDSVNVTNPDAVNKLILQLFYISIPLPPQLELPGHESLNISSEPLLVWQQTKDAATFHIQLARQADFTDF